MSLFRVAIRGIGPAIREDPSLENHRRYHAETGGVNLVLLVLVVFALESA
jgi:hypothetical protein